MRVPYPRLYEPGHYLAGCAALISDHDALLQEVCSATCGRGDEVIECCVPRSNGQLPHGAEGMMGLCLPGDLARFQCLNLPLPPCRQQAHQSRSARGASRLVLYSCVFIISGILVGELTRRHEGCAPMPITCLRNQAPGGRPRYNC